MCTQRTDLPCRKQERSGTGAPIGDSRRPSRGPIESAKALYSLMGLHQQRIEESTEEQRAGARRRGRRRAARERPLVTSRSLLPPPTDTEWPPRRSAAEAKRSLEICKLILSYSKNCTMYQVNTVPVRTNAGFSALPTSVKMVVTLRALTDSGWSETS